MIKRSVKNRTRKTRATNNKTPEIDTIGTSKCHLAPQCPYLEYQVNPNPRYGYGKPPHKKLYEIIDRNRAAYKHTLESFLAFKQSLLGIALAAPEESTEPCWHNIWLSALDSVALYSLLCLNNPKRYFEIGSGYSTKFARKAILANNLRTKIVSIDPYPRAQIDSICDTVIRKPVEDVDLRVFEELEPGDILFTDGTHRCSMNSDVAVIFLDILPRLKAGVLVEFHDIYIPYDYPQWCQDRYYSEQYLLAVYLLAEGDKFDIILPNTFINNDTGLKSILNPIWDATKAHEMSEGESFWIKTK